MCFIDLYFFVNIVFKLVKVFNFSFNFFSCSIIIFGYELDLMFKLWLNYILLSVKDIKYILLGIFNFVGILEFKMIMFDIIFSIVFEFSCM